MFNVFSEAFISQFYLSCGINASCVCQQESCLQVVVSMHRVCQQESCLQVVVSVHHVFVNKKAVYKLWCQCIMCLSTRKQFKSCGVNACYCYFNFI